MQSIHSLSIQDLRQYRWKGTRDGEEFTSVRVMAMRLGLILLRCEIPSSATVRISRLAIMSRRQLSH